MNCFYIKIAGRIEDLILAIVALGILVVSIEYVQFYLDNKETINLIHFSQRLCLFFSVILFTSYYFIAYSAYFTTKHISDSYSNLSARRMVAMYINDLAQVTIASWPYAILLIGTLTSAPDKISGISSVADIDISITIEQINLLFIIMLLWHVTVIVWYIISLGDKRDVVIHGIYVVIYAALVMITNTLMNYLVGEWIWVFILLYLCLVLSLYKTKGIPDIKASMASNKVIASG